MIHHEVAGDGAPALLFLHAAIGDLRMWEPQREAFGRSHRVIRCDLRGFGKSPPTAEPHSPVEDILAVLDATGTDAAVVVGASMGGRLAIELAITAPARADGLVLVGSALTGHDWSDEVRRMWQAEEDALAAGDLDRAVAINLDF